MSFKNIVLKVAFTTFLMQFGWLGLYSQTNDLQTIDSICRIALNSDFETGTAIIHEGFEKCSDNTSPNECQLLLKFTEAYLYQKQANLDKDNRVRYLKIALVRYGEALEMDTSNINTMINMVQVQQGLSNYKAALSLVNRLIILDETRRTKYYGMKGDIYYQNKDFLNAAKNYKIAFDFDYANEALCYKVFNSYLKIPDRNKGRMEIVLFSRDLMEMDMVNFAREGFLLGLNHSISTGNYDEAKEDCIGWANALSKKENINKSFALELPNTQKWNSNCNIEIQGLLIGERNSKQDLGWWMQDDFRRHILATLLLRLEGNALLQGNLSRAIGLLKSALEIAPDIHDYENTEALRNDYPVKVNIAIEFARLYNRYPDRIDREEYDELINELFNKKASHYLTRDTYSIQRSHTMLGLIYADRGEWESNSYARNAIFQLKRAIKYQKNLVREDESNFRPIPTLHYTLAKGYDEINQPDMAYSSYTEAAVGFLDMDNLAITDSIISLLKQHPGKTNETAKKLQEVELINDLRLDIRNNGFDFANSDISKLESELLDEYLFKKDDFTNDKSFINRQRFKVLADVGSQMTKYNPGYVQPVFEARSLDYLKKEKALGGFKDIDRLKQIEKKFENNIDDTKTVQVKKTNIYDKDQSSNTFSFYSGDRKSSVQIKQDLFIAGKIQEKIEEDESIPESRVPLYKVRDGEVTIPKEAEERDDADKSKILNIDGVKSVKEQKLKPLDKNYEREAIKK